MSARSSRSTLFVNEGDTAITLDDVGLIGPDDGSSSRMPVPP
jgi:hypothetical protein